MSEDRLTLSPIQREIVDATIRKHCALRGWHIHALNCRTNHIHIVVTAAVAPKTVAAQLKAWCTRLLKEDRAVSDPDSAPREKWWTEGESKHELYDDESLDAAIRYVLEGQ